MRKIIVICTSLVSLILTSHPVLAEQLRVDELNMGHIDDEFNSDLALSGCQIFLQNPRSEKLILSHVRVRNKAMEMRINGKKILFNPSYNYSYNHFKTASFLSKDGKIKVTIKVTKLGKKFVLGNVGEYQPIDRAILTVKKGKSQIKLNVKGHGGGCD